jgi:hypothetical protein
MSDPHPPDGKIFVGGLSWDTTAEALCAYFGDRFGEVTDAFVLNDKLTGKSRVGLALTPGGCQIGCLYMDTHRTAPLSLSLPASR